MNGSHPPDDLREPLDLWREEAHRSAARTDPDALHRAVLARADVERHAAPADRALRRYAVAAAVLIGVGASGSAALSLVPGPVALTEPTPVLGSIDDERLSLHSESEILSLPVVLQNR